MRERCRKTIRLAVGHPVDYTSGEMGASDSLILLLDTNILISLEPTSFSDLALDSGQAFELANLAQHVGAKLFVHPAQNTDLTADKNPDRRTLRLSLFQKYPALPSPPPVNAEVANACGNPTVGSNGWVDAQLVSALSHNSVAFLVTQDKGIHRACRNLGIDGRCLNLPAVVELLKAQQVVTPIAPPAVRSVPAHVLDACDCIFDGLRTDYGPEFDGWLTKCKQQHRQAWIASLPGEQNYSGVCIVNTEDRVWTDARNPTLKICTLKVADEASGLKLGELLLRTVFDFAHDNRFETLFVEVLPKHAALLHLLAQFGFEQVGHKTGTEEIIMRKRFSVAHDQIVGIKPLEFNRLFGPFAVMWEGVSGFVIPIEPRFHAALFPEMEPQGPLFPGIHSFGNTLRKAYVCRAQIRTIKPGHLVFFYRSDDWQSLTTAGVVEEVLPAARVDEMMELVRNRTVYERDHLSEMCRGDGGLGILFRHAPILRRPISLAELCENQILTAAPQSITTLKPTALEWIHQHL